MYSSDKPIAEFEDDLLGRSSFSKYLADAILSFPSNETLVVGLYGGWGTGKTSIINLAEKEINIQTQEISNEEKPIIMHFEPWNLTSSHNLTSYFFEELKHTLNIFSGANLNAIGKSLEEYSNVFQLLSLIPGASVLSSILPKIAENTGKALQTEKPLHQIKTELEKALREQKHKIIVIIDDIDRLPNEHIRMVFQLVKQVANLPNMIYILSMDREVVVRALEQTQNCNGNEYLEKIVQVSI